MSLPNSSSTEQRLRWELVGDGPPEGWRRGAQWFADDGTLDVLYTNAPEDANPHLHDVVFVKYRSVKQVRDVSEWRDAA